MRKQLFLSTLAAVYFFSNSALAYSAETNFWAERRRHTDLALASAAAMPRPLGDPRPAFQTQPISPAPALARHLTRQSFATDSPKNGSKTIHLIQDIHGHLEAQQTIAGAVEELLLSGGIDLIALEGAFGPIDLSPFRDHENKTAVRIVADFLLRENRISGPVYAALTNEISNSALPPIVGVDDPISYRSNVTALRQSLARKNKDEILLTRESERVEAEIKSLSNAGLRNFHSRISAYRSGQLPLLDYARLLAEQAESYSPLIALFLEAGAMERSLDLHRINNEQTAFVTQLLGKMNAAETAGLLDFVTAFKQGRLSRQEYYRELRRLSAATGVTLSSFRYLNAAIQHGLLIESLNPSQLLESLAGMEKAAYQKFASTRNELALVQKAAHIHLTSKLLNFSLTPEEWVSYRSQQSELSSGLNLSSYTDFYEEAERRDRAMALNLMKSLSNHEADTAVLVAGGFHSPGLRHILENANIQVIIYSPNVLTVPSDEELSHLSLLAGGPTGLDRTLFAAAAFLAGNPAKDFQNPHGIQNLLSATDINLATSRTPVKSGRLIVRFASDHRILSVASVVGLFTGSLLFFLHDHAAAASTFFVLALPVLWLLWSGTKGNQPRLRAQPFLTRSLLLPLLASFLMSGWGHASPADSFSPSATKQPHGVLARHGSWIQELNDPVLSSLIEKALADSPTLQAVAARLDRARASARRAGADKGLSASVGAELSVPPNRVDGFDRALDFFAQAIFEIDFLGRKKALREAARLDVLSAADQLRAAHQALSSEVARRYFETIGLNTQVALQKERRDAFEEKLMDLKLRVGLGLAAQNQPALASSRADLILAEEALRRLTEEAAYSLRSLEILIGDYPAGRLEIPKEVKSILPGLPLDAPIDILANRPDIQAAWRTLESQTKRTRFAKLDRWPRLSLGARGDLWSSDIDALADINNVHSRAFANLIAPLFEWGQRLANVQDAAAREKEAAALYAITVYQAYLEAETAIATARMLEGSESSLEEAFENLDETYRRSEIAHRERLLDTASLLDARLAALDMRIRYESARVDRYVNYVNLALALGRDDRHLSSSGSSLEKRSPTDSSLADSPRASKRQSWLNRHLWMGTVLVMSIFQFSFGALAEHATPTGGGAATYEAISDSPSEETVQPRVFRLVNSKKGGQRLMESARASRSAGGELRNSMQAPAEKKSRDFKLVSTKKEGQRLVESARASRTAGAERRKANQDVAVEANASERTASESSATDTSLSKDVVVFPVNGGLDRWMSPQEGSGLEISAGVLGADSEPVSGVTEDPVGPILETVVGDSAPIVTPSEETISIQIEPELSKEAERDHPFVQPEPEKVKVQWESDPPADGVMGARDEAVVEPTSIAPALSIAQKTQKAPILSLPSWLFWTLVLMGGMIGFHLMRRAWIKATDWLKAQPWTGLAGRDRSEKGEAGLGDSQVISSKDETLGLGKGGRLEYKYLVPMENVEKMMWELITVWGMIPDKHVKFSKHGKPLSYAEAMARGFHNVDIGPYPIISNYFENRNPKHHKFKHTMWERTAQHSKRAKIRLRFYPDLINSLLAKLQAGAITPQTLVDRALVFHAEVKRRYGERFSKLRVEVLMKHLDDLSHGINKPDFLPPDPKVSEEARYRRNTALGKWAYYRNQWRLEPFLWIAYERTPFHSADKRLRINFDENVRYAVHPRNRSLLNETTGLPVFPKDDDFYETYPGHVVFEIKFEGDPPEWVTELVQAQGLVAMGTSKVVDSDDISINERYDLWRPRGMPFDPQNRGQYLFFETPLSVTDPPHFEPYLDLQSPSDTIALASSAEGEVVEEDGRLNDPEEYDPSINRPTSTLSSFLAAGLIAAGLFSAPNVVAAASVDAVFAAISPFTGVDWMGFWRSLLPLYHVMSNAFLAGMVLAHVYKWTQEGGVSYDRKFTTAVALLPILVASMVFTLISGHTVIAVTLGVIGIAGMISFRTILRATLDMMYIAAGIAAGVAIGTEYYAGVWMLVAVFFLAVGFYHSVEFGVQNRVNLQINFTWKGTLKELTQFEDAVLASLSERTGFFKDDKGIFRTALSELQPDASYNVSYRIRLVDPSNATEAIALIKGFKISDRRMIEDFSSLQVPLERGWLLILIRFLLRMKDPSSIPAHGSDTKASVQKIPRAKAPLDLLINKMILRYAPGVVFVLLFTVNVLTLPKTALAVKPIPGKVLVTQAPLFSLVEGHVAEVLVPRLADAFVQRGDPLIKIRTMTPQQYVVELELLVTELEVEQARLKNEHARVGFDWARALVNVQQSWVTWQRHMIDLEVQQALHPGLTDNLQRLATLAGLSLVPDAELETARASVNASQARIDRLKQLTAQAEKNYNAISQLHPGLTHEAEASGATGPISETDQARERFLASSAALQRQFLARMRALDEGYEHVVVAPFDGIVSEIPVQPGVAVFRQTPLATVTSRDMNTIRTYLIPPFDRLPQVGDDVSVLLRGYSREIFKTHITRVAPEMKRVDNDLQRGAWDSLLYPQNLARTPLGLEIDIKIPPEMLPYVRPNELVDVRLTRPGASRGQDDKPAPQSIRLGVSDAPEDTPASQPEEGAAAPEAPAPAQEPEAPSIGELGGRAMSVSATGSFALAEVGVMTTPMAAFSPVREALLIGSVGAEKVAVVRVDGSLIETVDMSGLINPDITIGQKPVLKNIAWMGGHRFAFLYQNPSELVVVDIPPGETRPLRASASVHTLPESLTTLESLAVIPSESPRLFVGGRTEEGPAILEVSLGTGSRPTRALREYVFPWTSLSSLTALAALAPSEWDNVDPVLLILDGAKKQVFQLHPDRRMISRSSLVLAKLDVGQPTGLALLPNRELLILSADRGGQSVSYLKLRANDETRQQPPIVRGAGGPAPLGALALAVAMVQTLFQRMINGKSSFSVSEKDLIWVPVFDRSDIGRLNALRRSLPPAFYGRVMVTVKGSDKDLMASVREAAASFTVVDAEPSIGADGRVDLDRILEEMLRQLAADGSKGVLQERISELVAQTGGRLITVSGHPERIVMSSYLEERNTFYTILLGLWVDLSQPTLYERLHRAMAPLRHA